MGKMRNSYLIQRLNPPHPRRGDGLKVDEVFAFGGGLARGGLSKEAFDLLSDLWAWDYMGAAEFEFGAVPRALHAIATERDNLAAFEISVDYAHRDWKSRTDLAGTAPVWILCPAWCREEVERRVRYHASHEYPDDPGFRTKEMVGLARSLAGAERSAIGWLELDNGYLFFSRREPWEGFCQLIGVEVPESQVTALAREGSEG